MKVLIINTRCGSGSTGKIVSDIYNMLQNYGHQVKVAFSHGTPTNVNISDTYRITDKWGYYIHNLLTQITDRAGFYSSAETKRFIRFIDTYKPDVVHLHNIHGYYINIELIFNYLKATGVPVIWTLHDCWAFTGHCYHYSSIGCNKWLSQCFECPLKHLYPKSRILDQSTRNYEDKKKLFTSLDHLFLVTPSKWLRDEVKKSFLSKYEVEAIPNGIDLTIFKHHEGEFRYRYGISNNMTLLLAVSFVWTKAKGIDDLIILNSRIDKAKYKLMIVGLEKDQQEKLPSDIVTMGRTSSIQELAEIYSMADIFINPSYEETMGMVTAEALACGTPAIVYNKTAVPEVVDNNSGVVVEAGDVDQIVKSLPIALNLKRTNARNRAMLYEKNRQYKEYYKIYLKSFNIYE